MKRIGVLVSVAALFLACVVPAGAYQWNGESFLDDYYGAMPLAMEFDSGSFSFSGVKDAHIVYSGSFKQSFDFTSFSVLNIASPSYISCYDDFTYESALSFSDSVMGDSSFSYSFSDLIFTFTFKEPVSSFSLGGFFRMYADINSYFYVSDASLSYLRSSFSLPYDLLVDGSVVRSFPSGSNSMDGISYSSDSPITSFSFRCSSFQGDISLSTPRRFCGSGARFFLFSPSSSFTITTVPYEGPVVPGEGDFEYTEISGAELAKDMVLGPNVATGGANVYWTYDSYETGVPPYEVTVPGGAAHQMAPARFPSISLSKSEATVTASIPSTSYTFSWEGGCRVERFESLLTGPPGFSGPGSSALDYVELQIPISSEEPVHNFDLTGAVPVETVYRAGSRSVTRVGGAWSLYVNGALVTSGTTDTYGNIQFNGFVYHSSEPITAITLRLVPTAAGLAFPSNTGRITFSWSMSLDFKDLSMVYLEGDDEAIDLDKFYQQVSDSQGSIDSYDKIESQWTDNMTSNWDALKLDEFSFDAGLISGFALLSGIFNDIWRAFGLFNVVWIAPLMLGISMLVIGRISRDGGKGKGSG